MDTPTGTRQGRRPLRQSKSRQHLRKLRGGKPRGFPLPGLWYYRLLRGLTQAELATRAGVSCLTIVHLESGERTAYANTVYKLATALQVSRWALMREPST